jgi:hypothetical protein
VYHMAYSMQFLLFACCTGIRYFCRRVSKRSDLEEIEQLVNETSAAGIAFWKGIDVVIHLLSPIMVLLRKADGEQACLGIIYQQMSQVLKQVDMLALHGNLNECRKRRDAVRTVIKARGIFCTNLSTHWDLP